MEYIVNKLSKMSGVSARTLRYYDGIGLLKPARVEPSGYRVYGQPEVDTLQQKFEGFKQSLIDENEQKYGAEVRAMYGDQAVDESNAHLMGLSKEQYDQATRIGAEFEATLKAAFDTGDPAGELAQNACDLHRQMLWIFYPKYSKEYHKGLGEMYVADERFRVNYDKLAPGCTEFLRDAINIYCK